MKKTLEMLKQEFESSSGKTPQFMGFVRLFKKEFKEFLKTYGCNDVEINIGHFYLYGFFKHQEQLWYFNIGDVRWQKDMFIRTAKDNKDFTGGRNRFLNMDNVCTLSDNFKHNVDNK